MLSAAASVGMIMLWDVDGLSKVDKYLYSNEDHIKVCSMTLLGKKKRESNI